MTKITKKLLALCFLAAALLMSTGNRVVNHGAAPAFTYHSVYFDGTTNYLTRGANLTGSANGKAGTISFWIKATDEYVPYFVLCLPSDWSVWKRDGSDGISFSLANAAGANILVVNSPVDMIWVTSSPTWHHVMASWDLAGGPAVKLYIDGVDRTITPTATNDTISYNEGDWGVGARVGGENLFQGWLSELYFTETYLDLSVSGNRDKFFNSTTQKPVDLGADGSTPTGTQPLIYFHASQWASNAGSGGTFTVNGTLADGGAEKP